jgi:hypothetical protein
VEGLGVGVVAAASAGGKPDFGAVVAELLELTVGLEAGSFGAPGAGSVGVLLGEGVRFGAPEAKTRTGRIRSWEDF